MLFEVEPELLFDKLRDKLSRESEKEEPEREKDAEPGMLFIPEP